ncbi:MAG: ATP-dependent sacrificial sulfur transferase LarE [Anaeromyxobacter sp.]
MAAVPGDLEAVRRDSAGRLARMRSALAGLDGALVAFSGGVDSTFVLAIAREVLGDRAVALTAHSPSVPAAEREEARRLAAGLGARHLERTSREGEDPRYRANPVDRCYFCKDELYRLCEAVAREEGLSAILDGFNADDHRDHRPGRRAGLEHGVRSPLSEAGLTKLEVRAWSAALGLPTWDKPQMACLASRIPYGTEVTPERLARVEAAEAALRGMGFHDLRVRYHGDLGRVELGEAELEEGFRRRGELVAAVKGAGFKLAVLDLEPFRSGRMNALAGVALPVVAP